MIKWLSTIMLVVTVGLAPERMVTAQPRTIHGVVASSQLPPGEHHALKLDYSVQRAGSCWTVVMTFPRAREVSSPRAVPKTPIKPLFQIQSSDLDQCDAAHIGYQSPLRPEDFMYTTLDARTTRAEIQNASAEVKKLLDTERTEREAERKSLMRTIALLEERVKRLESTAASR
jgi:hypothetical protein